LDETYERVLREIKKPNRDHAQRLLQCLVVAIRPLRVEELAEVLAVDFDDAEGIPKLNPNWRWEDQEQALLTSCSSLIAIVHMGSSRVVQFSHFSVKEYLTSARLATSGQDVSRYRVVLGIAHTILAQACLSILLQPDKLIEESGVENNEKRSPLAVYAAEYWVRHAQFEDVASRIRGIEDLFDPDRPYFTAWYQLYDIDTEPPSDTSPFFQFFPRVRKSGAKTPLYYAALCGLPNLVEQLIVKHPEHVNAIGGLYVTPVVAALAGRHFQVAELLHRNGSSIDPRGDSKKTPLNSAACCEDLEMVQVLLDYRVDVNAQDEYGFTPLSRASCYSNEPRVVRLLLDHGADPNVRTWRPDGGSTPLHLAVERGQIEIARILLEHGASVDAQDGLGNTPLDVVSGAQRDEIITLLLEHRRAKGQNVVQCSTGLP
jgi:ankyrin repeat protein